MKRCRIWGLGTLLLLLPLVGFLFTQCARVIALSGGEKDVMPPRIVRTVPANGATHFTGKRVKITFDEYVNLKDAQKEIYFSPPFRWPYGTTLQGRSLVFDIVDTLQADVTYRLHLGTAIEDLTEKNPFRDTLFTFSTGATIDTHVLHGTVRDALSHDPAKGVRVMLYREATDSVVYKALPNYVAASDADGRFRFDNLPAGVAFKLFALEDANANHRYDQPQKERVAFRDSLVTPLPLGQDSLQAPLTLDLFTFARPPLVLTSATRPVPEDIQLIFSTSTARSLVLRDSLGNTPSLVLEPSFSGDTARFWLTDAQLARQDSLFFTVRYTGKVPYNDEVRTDTLRLAYSFAKPDRDSTGVLLPIERRLSDSVLRIAVLNTNKGLAVEDSLRLELSSAVTRVAEERLYLLPDSVGVKLLPVPEQPRQFLLHAPWKARRTYDVVALPGAFTDAFGRTNDTVKLRFATLNPSQFSVLHLTLQHFPPNALVQVLSSDGKKTLLRSLRVAPQATRLDIPYLAPGTYELRIVDDQNANGVWDTGNYLLHQQPESVRYYKNEKGQSTLSLRTNWEYDVTVDYTTLEE
ncbi:MAG: Ig-like domain-containing protein [Bacteroides sp.]